MERIWRMIVETWAGLSTWRIDGPEQPSAGTVVVKGDGQMLLPGIAEPHRWEAEGELWKVDRERGMRAET